MLNMINNNIKFVNPFVSLRGFLYFLEDFKSSSPITNLHLTITNLEIDPDIIKIYKKIFKKIKIGKGKVSDYNFIPNLNNKSLHLSIVYKKIDLKDLISNILYFIKKLKTYSAQTGLNPGTIVIYSMHIGCNDKLKKKLCSIVQKSLDY